MSSLGLRNRRNTLAPQKRSVVSITIDRQAGGIANALVSYSDALTTKGYHHTIILPPSAIVVPTLEKMKTVNLIKIPTGLIKFHLLTRGFFSQHIRAALAEADVFFLHNSVLLQVLKPTEKPCFLVNHSGKTRHLDRADHIIFLTKIMRCRTMDKLPQLASRKDKLHVLPHGFSTKKPKKRAQPPKAPPKSVPVKLVSAGRFVKKKGFATLIEAARISQAAGITCQIDIYGAGPLKPSLQNQIASSGLTSVTLQDWSDDLKSIFADADLFCSPSLDEPFGLVIGEAMAMGLPVIASDTDGANELFGINTGSANAALQHGGMIVPAGDTAALAAAIGRFCANEKLRQTAGRNAQKRIETNFTQTHMADHLDKLIRSVTPSPEAERSYI